MSTENDLGRDCGLNRRRMEVFLYLAHLDKRRIIEVIYSLSNMLGCSGVEVESWQLINILLSSI